MVFIAFVCAAVFVGTVLYRTAPHDYDDDKANWKDNYVYDRW